jgi:hypothetical protein
MEAVLAVFAILILLGYFSVLAFAFYGLCR